MKGKLQNISSSTPCSCQSLIPLIRISTPAQFTFKQGETDMGDKGKKDKGKKEQQKKAQLNPKEKRKMKKEKKN